MIQVAPQMRILVAIEAVDLRKGIDGLAQLCREKLGADLFMSLIHTCEPIGVDAVELPRASGTAGNPQGRVIE